MINCVLRKWLPARWRISGIAIVLIMAAQPGLAQVKTEVPPVVPGAKPVTVDHIKIHGEALEGNLEGGDAVDRDVVVFLPPAYALAGHSMGGYGATRIGMKHPDVFGSLYIMSPCCLSPMGSRPVDPARQQAMEAQEKALESVKTPADSAGLQFFARAQLASAAAWSPDPKNPPLYLDLLRKGGVPQPDVIANWAANAPLAFVDQYIDNLRQYHAIAMDVGDRDGLRFDAGKLHDVLDKYGIANSFEIYHSTHTSAVADRFQNHVIPFFSRNLCATQNCK